MKRVNLDRVGDEHMRGLLTQAIEQYTGQRPSSIEYVKDPEVEGTIAVRAAFAEAPQGANDYLVYYGIPGSDLIVEDVEFNSWPPVEHHKGHIDASARGDAGVVWHGKPKYPEITVQLIGTDGNAFAVMGAVSKALKQAGISPRGQAPGGHA